MRMDRSSLLGLAAVSGLVSIGFGAFAAHGIADAPSQSWLRTGASYQMGHALAVYAGLAALPRAPHAPLAAALFLIGSVTFAGTLYAMALGAPRWLGAVTPLGGLVMMAGWIVLAWSAFRSRDNQR